MEAYNFAATDITLEVVSNYNDVTKNDLHISLDNGLEMMWLSVTGKDEIKKFIYAAAVHGGLIKEGDTLTVQPLKEVPEDGIYLMNEGDNACHVYVEGGRFYVPQYKSDVMYDCTEEYLRRDDWKVVPMKKEDS